MTTVTQKRARVTQFPKPIVQKASVSVRDCDRQIAALSLGLAIHACGRTGKEVAQAIKAHPSTISRYTNGRNDSPISQTKELLRQMAADGIYPIHVIADLIADVWDATPIRKWTADQLRARKQVLHQQEEDSTHEVNVWQLADSLAGGHAVAIPREQVFAALLNQIGRTVELYVIECELWIREQRRTER